MISRYSIEFRKERKEHPTLPAKTIARIVSDHMKGVGKR